MFSTLELTERERERTHRVFGIIDPAWLLSPHRGLLPLSASSSSLMFRVLGNTWSRSMSGLCCTAPSGVLKAELQVRRTQTREAETDTPPVSGPRMRTQAKRGGRAKNRSVAGNCGLCRHLPARLGMTRLWGRSLITGETLSREKSVFGFF